MRVNDPSLDSGDDSLRALPDLLHCNPLCWSGNSRMTYSVLAHSVLRIVSLVPLSVAEVKNTTEPVGLMTSKSSARLRMSP